MQGSDGQWVEVPYLVEPWKEIHSEGWTQQELAHIEKAKAAGMLIMPASFDARRYSLFGILGNVRNGSGFAGVDTGDSWPSITDRRGLPADSPIDINRESDYDEPDGKHWLGDHSHTYVTLDELLAFDWDGTVCETRGL